MFSLIRYVFLYITKETIIKSFLCPHLFMTMISGLTEIMRHHEAKYSYLTAVAGRQMYYLAETTNLFFS